MTAGVIVDRQDSRTGPTSAVNGCFRRLRRILNRIAVPVGVVGSPDLWRRLRKGEVMDSRSGISSSLGRVLALTTVAFCLFAGALAGCGGNDDSDVGADVAGQSPSPATVDQGTTDQGPDPADSDGNAGKNNPETEKGADSGSANPPPQDIQARLKGIGRGLAGQFGVVVSAPGGPGQPVLTGELATGPALSTISLPIAQRVLEGGGGPSGVGEETRGQINAAVSLSDTEATRALFSRLASSEGGPEAASEAVGQTLRAAGGGPAAISISGDTGPGSGRGAWPLDAQSRYMAALAGGCVGDAATRRFLLAQMAPADGRENYGLGSIGSGARWTGGTGVGPAGNLLARQTGVLETTSGPVVVAMMVLPGDGSSETAEAMLNDLTDGLVSRLNDHKLPRLPCPSGGGVTD